MPRKRRRTMHRSWGQRAVVLLGVLVTAALLALAGTAYSLNRQLAGLRQIGLSLALTPRSGSASNYLLVGSDSRAGSDPSDPDFGSMGDEGEVGGGRSDTIMVLRVGGPEKVSILSLPRDLYVQIAGSDSEDRINGAFSRGAATLIETVEQNFDIPINHYVEVDFQGFKRMVDAVGGVELCFDAPARDANTGLVIGAPGCYVLDGVGALAYARSRHFETQDADGEWREDPTGDIGRIARQQGFIRAIVAQGGRDAVTNPFAARRLMDAMVDSMTVDDGLTGDDLLRLALKLRGVASGELPSTTFPATPKTVGGKAVLIPDLEAAAPVIAAFNG